MNFVQVNHKSMYKGDNTGYIVQQDEKIYKNDTVTKHLDCIYYTDKLSVFACCCVHGHKIYNYNSHFMSN